MHQHGSKYFAHRPPLWSLEVGSKCHNSTFIEHGHVSYKKGMMKAATCKYILSPYRLPWPLGWVKGQNISLKVVMLHIKLTSIMKADLLS